MILTDLTDDDYERLPGLYHAWDFAMLLEEGRSYLIEDGVRSEDGQPMFQVFQRTEEGGGVRNA